LDYSQQIINWNKSSTWLNGNKPSENNISGSKNVYIRHTVTRTSNNTLKVSGLVHIEPIEGTTAKLILKEVNVENKGIIKVINGYFQNYRFNGGGDSGNERNGNFYNMDNGYVEVINGVIETAQDWKTEKKAKSYFENACVLVGENYTIDKESSSNNYKDVYITSNISLGWHGSGNYKQDKGTIEYNGARIQLAGTSGNFELNNSKASGSIELITFKNHETGGTGGGEIKSSSSLNGNVQLNYYYTSSQGDLEDDGNVFTGNKIYQNLTDLYFPNNCGPSEPVVDTIYNYFPAEGSYGTLAFEDLWPYKGDYDFNDMVIDYNFEILTNSDNYVFGVNAEFIVKASGAGFKNGFGFQLSDDLNISDLSVSGYELNENYINLNSDGLELNQSKPTIIVFDNVFTLMPHPGSGIGVNTTPGAPYVQPYTIEIAIQIVPDTYTSNDLDVSNFNPFIIVDMNREKEVHLPNYPPTDLADINMLGTGDDDSDSGSGRYYKTENNLPWAINIYESFDYPNEKSAINEAYLKFVEWATSGGNNYPDWYQDQNGYRDNDFIYNSN